MILSNSLQMKRNPRPFHDLQGDRPRGTFLADMVSVSPGKQSSNPEKVPAREGRREMEMERRVHPRFPVRQSPSGGSRTRFPIRILNVSRTGCFLESRLPVGEPRGRFTFELPLPTGEDTLTLSARIIWEDRDGGGAHRCLYRYGLRFEPMDSISELILDAYLDFLRRDLHVAQLEEAWRKLKQVHEKIEILIAAEEKKTTAFLH